MTTPPPTFPPFSLSRLLKTVFGPLNGERVCILIDLEHPETVKDLSFLNQGEHPIQRKAVDVFYRGLHDGIMDELGLQGGELYAYKRTGGSNLDMPPQAWDINGQELLLADAVYPNYDLILCISTDSATAPLTAYAKTFGFRGATMHGVNDIILQSGLSVDYTDVSKETEKLRLGMTGAETVEIDFDVHGSIYTLKLELSGKDAQKSHGLCPPGPPDVANLPAGEIYYVPTGAEGQFPHPYEDGTISIATVTQGKITRLEYLSGHEATVDTHRQRITSDPVTGELGELGFGTQVLPFSGADIQDEKVLGTLHVATGRSDHLGGDLTPDKFAKAGNATHDDILFHPEKTPAINVKQARMYWPDGRSDVLIEGYTPSAYMAGLLA